MDQDNLGIFEDIECLLCGRCLEVCPLFEATDQEELSPRAKGFLLQELARSAKDISENKAKKLAGICLHCSRCSRVCPQEIDLSEIISNFKSIDPGWQSWIWKRIVSGLPIIFPLLSQWGQGFSRVFPEQRKGQIESLNRKNCLKPWLFVQKINIKKQSQGTSAVIYPGCTAGFAKTNWLDIAYSLVKKAGYKLLSSPDWKCCGFTLGQNGLKQEQKALNLFNLKQWRDLGRPLLIVFCTTCFKALKQMTQRDLDWQEGEQTIWLDSLIYLSSILEEGEFLLKNNAPQRGVLAHIPCHAEHSIWNWLQITLEKEELSIDKLDACCGMGGILQLENPNIPYLVGKKFWEKIKDYSSEQLLTACSGCYLQLNSQKPKNLQVGHWLEILEI